MPGQGRSLTAQFVNTERAFAIELNGVAEYRYRAHSVCDLIDGVSIPNFILSAHHYHQAGFPLDCCAKEARIDSPECVNRDLRHVCPNLLERAVDRWVLDRATHNMVTRLNEGTDRQMNRLCGSTREDNL